MVLIEFQSFHQGRTWEQGYWNLKDKHFVRFMDKHWEHQTFSALHMQEIGGGGVQERDHANNYHKNHF